jgi:hypothetical protein
VAGTKYAPHRGAGDQLPADAVAAQVDPAQRSEARGAEELHRAQVQDERARDGSVSFHVAGQIDAVARVDLAADGNHHQIRGGRGARGCPTPLLDFTDVPRVWTVDATRTAGRHDHLLGIEVRGVIQRSGVRRAISNRRELDVGRRYNEFRTVWAHLQDREN